MAYRKTEKKPGDLMESKDWNALSAEVERLGKAKLDSSDAGTLSGSLSVGESIDFGKSFFQIIKSLIRFKNLRLNRDKLTLKLGQ